MLIILELSEFVNSIEIYLEISQIMFVGSLDDDIDIKNDLKK